MSFLTRVLYDCLKHIYAYLHEGVNVSEYHSCLKMIVQAHLRIGLFTIFFSKHVPFKQFYLNIKLLQ